MTAGNSRERNYQGSSLKHQARSTDGWNGEVCYAAPSGSLLTGRLPPVDVLPAAVWLKCSGFQVFRRGGSAPISTPPHQAFSLHIIKFGCCIKNI